MKTRAGAAGDLALIFALKAAVLVWVVAAGFTHVSDDDYARVVIAESFAHAPKLDPSGTSWLPLPFWLYGGAMMAFGRSLATARVVACVLGILATAPPYFALRAVGAGRAAAVVGVTIAMTLPWSAWTGVAPIPEALTAGLVAAAAIATARPELAMFAAVCALAASLSRYEAWPACAVVAALALLRGRRVGAATVAAMGPVLWIAWNAHTHGDPMHFVARVAAFRQASGAAAAPLAEKLLGFPGALVRGASGVAGLGAFGLAVLAMREVRARWLMPVVTAASIVVFLVIGDVRDGAPTHHPERALLPVWWILAMFGVDAAEAIARRAARRVPAGLVLGASAALTAAFVAQSARYWTSFPGRGAEDRAAQVARGHALRARDPARIEVAPCTYEHFALLAAFGAPERAEIAPMTRAPVSSSCPRVLEK